MRANDPNEITFQFWPLKIAVKGKTAICLFAPAVTILALVIAWRLAI